MSFSLSLHMGPIFPSLNEVLFRDYILSDQSCQGYTGKNIYILNVTFSLTSQVPNIRADRHVEDILQKFFEREDQKNGLKRNRYHISNIILV